MNTSEKVQHDARQRADRLVESLAGNVPKLVDTLVLLDEKLTSARLQGTPFEVAAALRGPILPGISGQRLAVIAIMLSAGGGATTFNFQQGSGANFGPLTGKGGGGTMGLTAGAPSLVVVGAPEAPILIADVANDIAINNIGANAIVGHAVWMTIEP